FQKIAEDYGSAVRTKNESSSFVHEIAALPYDGRYPDRVYIRIGHRSETDYKSRKFESRTVYGISLEYPYSQASQKLYIGLSKKAALELLRLFEAVLTSTDNGSK